MMRLKMWMDVQVRILIKDDGIFSSSSSPDDGVVVYKSLFLFA